MGKNIRKSSKKTPKIEFTISKKDFSKMLKPHFDYINQYNINILNGICVESKNGILQMASTNGSRLLVTQHDIEQNANLDKVVLDTRLLKQLKFVKGLGIKISNYYMDTLDITISKEGMQIKESLNNIAYVIPNICGEYPKYEQLIPKEDGRHIFYLRRSDLMNCIKNLDLGRADILKFAIPKDPKACITIQSWGSHDCKSQILLMPCEVEEND